MTSTALVVVGGAYGEECAFPAKRMYRGSGGRAAAVLSSLGVAVTLSTVTGPHLSAVFQSIAQKLGYTLDAKAGHQDIWFRYRHPLGRPDIYPVSPAPFQGHAPVEADLALAFGMIEGRPVVRARRAVYDPQDGALAQDFTSNGSSADELAIVASYSEAKALTGESDPVVMAGRLLDAPHVAAVIIKCGPQGALVKTDKAESWVRAFPTGRVYKVGSGDVFSAAFAFAWLVENQDAVSAAWLASRMVAAYVEFGHDRFDAASVPGLIADSQAALAKFGAEGPRKVPATQIYLAGPFFNTAQQWLIDEARGALTDMGFKVFSPVHEVGFGPAEEVAPADLHGLDESGLVLAIMDGLDPGTIFEIGYARAKRIPVVVVAESVDANALTMVLGSGCEVTNDFTTGIYSACWHLMGDV